MKISASLFQTKFTNKQIPNQKLSAATLKKENPHTSQNKWFIKCALIRPTYPQQQLKESGSRVSLDYHHVIIYHECSLFFHILTFVLNHRSNESCVVSLIPSPRRAFHREVNARKKVRGSTAWVWELFGAVTLAVYDTPRIQSGTTFT